MALLAGLDVLLVRAAAGAVATVVLRIVFIVATRTHVHFTVIVAVLVSLAAFVALLACFNVLLVVTVVCHNLFPLCFLQGLASLVYETRRRRG